MVVVTLAGFIGRVGTSPATNNTPYSSHERIDSRGLRSTTWRPLLGQLARGSPRSANASCCQASSSAAYRSCSRHQPLRVALSIPAVAINTCSRAAAVSADCLQSDRQIHWPTRPHANAPASLHSLQPRETPAPPTNSPAATVAPRSDPCTPVRIEPLPDVRAPKGSDPIRATTSLTQGNPRHARARAVRIAATIGRSGRQAWSWRSGDRQMPGTCGRKCPRTVIVTPTTPLDRAATPACGPSTTQPMALGCGRRQKTTNPMVRPDMPTQRAPPRWARAECGETRLPSTNTPGSVTVAQQGTCAARPGFTI